MINDDMKCIFVHNPKTGGTSIKTYLNTLKLRSFQSKFIPGEFKRGEWHYNLEQLCSFASGDSSDYFKFGTCRNPYSRLVSAFVYNCRNCEDRNNYHWKSYPDSYPIIRKWISRDSGNYIENFRYFVRSSDFDKIFDNRWPIHFREQKRFFTPGELDFLIKYESLQDDLDNMLECRNLPSVQLPVLNNSNHVDYRRFYDIQTMELVSKKYHEDFKTFGYNPVFLGAGVGT